MVSENILSHTNKKGRCGAAARKGAYMKIENLERANEIQNRMKELETVREWLEDKDRHVYMLASGCTVDKSVKISSDVRSLLYGLSIGEHKRLQEEFEKL